MITNCDKDIIDFLQNKAMLITPKLKKHVYEADFDYNQYL